MTPIGNARPVWERFWEKVDRRGPDDCWEWMARKCPLGYGRLFLDGKVRLAHHISCMLHGIPIPGYPKSKNVIDHRCGNRGCVNPAHLRIVTQAENCGPLARPTPHWRNKNKTHCIRGHEFTLENTLRDQHGNRQCRACRQMHNAKWRAKKAQDVHAIGGS